MTVRNGWHIIVVCCCACHGPAAVGPDGVIAHETAGGTRWDGSPQYVPYQDVPPVPPRVVGVLVSRGEQPWGHAISFGPLLDDKTDRREYTFSFDRSSPYALYFASDGRGNNFIKGWGVPLPDGGSTQLDAAMFDPTTDNDWGLGRSAHLVELEVNGGRGGTGPHFVATSVRVLDGSDAHPLRVDEVLGSLRARFDFSVASTAKRRAAMMNSMRSAARSGGSWAAPIEKVAVWPTWLRDDEQLEVVFLHYLTHAVTLGQDRNEIGVATAATYRVDDSGKVTSEHVPAPTAFGALPDGGGSEAPAGSHLTVDKAVMGNVCQGVPGPVPRYRNASFAVQTAEPLRVEAIRVGEECVSLAGIYRNQVQRVATPNGERLHVGVSGGAALCPVVPKLGTDDAQLLYRVSGALFSIRFRFEEAPQEPCTAP